MAAAIRVENFSRDFKVGLRGRLFRAAVDINLEVQEGEIFGFLGPNGAGKTTTIKAILGLIGSGKSGRIEILGHAPSSAAWRRHVGYLPETPNFYEYLTGLELVTWFGQLTGYSRHEAEASARRQLERVKLAGAMTRRIRSYSKGMLQRAALAQAMIGNPKLLILDEPMTGLDPIGRRDMRELLLELRGEGTTIFYSTHILPDVEMTCDRVAIVHQGRTLRTGSLRDILGGGTRAVTVRLSKLSSERVAAIRVDHRVTQTGADWIEVDLPDIDVARVLIGREVGAGALLEALVPHREDLETIFVRTLGNHGVSTP